MRYTGASSLSWLREDLLAPLVGRRWPVRRVICSPPVFRWFSVPSSSLATCCDTFPRRLLLTRRWRRAGLEVVLLFGSLLLAGLRAGFRSILNWLRVRCRHTLLVELAPRRRQNAEQKPMRLAQLVQSCNRRQVNDAAFRVPHTRSCSRWAHACGTPSRTPIPYKASTQCGAHAPPAHERRPPSPRA